VVEQPARSRNDDVDAAMQRLYLRLHADAAVDGRRANLHILAVGADAFLDLQAELAGRGNDQDADFFRGRRLLRKKLEDRQREAGGLAGSGLRGAEKVFAGENDGDGLRLDRGGNGVALLGDSAEQLGRQAE
jgi:hypothetical protein